MATPPPPDQSSTPATGGSSSAPDALARHYSDAEANDGADSAGTGLDDAARSIAPAVGPWSDGLGRAGSRAAQTLLVAAVVAGVLWVLLRVTLVVIAVLVALILASAVGPLVHWLERKGWSNLMATLAAFIGILLLIGGVITGIVFTIRNQWETLTSQAASGWNELQRLLEQSPLPVDTATLDSAVQRVSDVVASGSFAGNAANSALTGLSAAATFLTGLVLMIVVLFFFLKDGTKMWNFFLRWFHGARRAKLAEAADRSSQVLGGYVRGTAFVALIDAVLIGIGLAIVGVPLALPLAVVVFVTAFIPVIGATIAGILAALVALFTNGVVAALIVVAIVVAVNQIEGNILQPIIMGKTLSLHALVVLLALTVGTLVGGIFGAILAVPYTAVAWAVIQVWTDRYQTGDDPVLGEDPLDPRDRVAAKATMAERWKYQRMRMQNLGGGKLGAAKRDAAEPAEESEKA
ncbi:AI-2E family transporter [Kocuria kalidii]|uniref:AI-2E family transporter n=1 Tax=Kocuria kalidii TaxID=3376283 RepID=UPI0037AF1580